MKGPKNIYINPQTHLTENQLIRYQNDEMNNAEMHLVERHLLSCELCSDALEGTAMLEPDQLHTSIQDLKGRLSERVGDNKRKRTTGFAMLGIAASVLLLFSTAIYLVLNTIEPKEPDIAKIEIKEEQLSYPAKPKAEDTGNAENKANSLLESAKPVTEITKEDIIPNKEEEQKSFKEEPVLIKQEPVEVVSTPQKEEPTIALEDVAKIKEKSLADREEDVIVISPQKADKNVSARTFQAEKPRVLTENKSENRNLGANNKIIKIRVTDSSGEPLPGATVRIMGTGIGANTNLDGELSLKIPDSNTQLQFSYIGFVTKKVTIDAKITEIEAALEEDVKTLSEVVVTGYATPTQKSMTGSIATIQEVTPPKPEDGMRRFKRYLKESVQYPAAAKEAKVEGIVEIEFFVEQDGSLTNIQVVKSLGHGLDEEAIRLIKEGPKWKPAQTDNAPVRHRFKVEVSFKLN